MSNFKKTIVVKDGTSIPMIKKAGGSFSWRIDPDNASQHDYLVCCRSAVKGADEDVDARSAFLVGKISGIAPTPDPAASGRYIIYISEYALVNIPNVWKKEWQNPVRYTSLDALGIDIESLDFQPMPEREEMLFPTPSSPAQVVDQPLTISDAKRGLAKTFGVPEENIQITICG